MGCSNARLLVQQSPLDENPHVISSKSKNSAAKTARLVQSSPFYVDDNLQNRVHLNGVDLVVERNGSYTLLLTPKTHKQLMPYVMRKKRFRILVDKTSSSTIDPCLSSTQTLTQQQANVQSEDSIISSTMESSKELKIKQKHNKRKQFDKNVEFIEQQANNELEKSKRQLDQQILGGTSIDDNLADDDDYLQSDDEGMMEEIITTVEEDKDLECKVKKKIETKKTIAEDPETHNKVTKVVKTEVTEITRTITINDQHDLERAKRELGIDDVTRFLPPNSSGTSMQQNIYNLPSSRHILPSYLTAMTNTTGTTWSDRPTITEIQEVRYDPNNEVVTSGDFGDERKEKALLPTHGVRQLIEQGDQLAGGIQDIQKQQKPIVNNDAALAGRGIDATISIKPSIYSSTSQKSDIEPITTVTPIVKSTPEPIIVKKKTKRSGGLCSCTSPRETTSDDERKQEQTKIVEKKSKLKKKTLVSPVGTITATADQVKSNQQITTAPISLELPKSVIDLQTTGKQLITDPVKQLIINKKQPLIDYFHSQVFSKANLLTSKSNNVLGQKISSRILDLLRYNRCSSWENVQGQVREEYGDQIPSSLFIQPMCETYETIFTTKEPQLLKLFENETTPSNDNVNLEFVEIVKQSVANKDKKPNIGYVATQFVNNVQDSLDRLTYTTTPPQYQNGNNKEQERPLATKDSGITTSFSAESGEFHSGGDRSLSSGTMIDVHSPQLEQEPVLTSSAIVNDDQLNKITNKILSQTDNKPNTLAEAIAYDYLDLTDIDVVNSLGLPLEVAAKMKKVFLPIDPPNYGDDYKSNLVQVRRFGEPIAELDFADSNALEKINLPEDVAVHLRYAFEQPLDLREKQLKQLSYALQNTNDLEFAISPSHLSLSKHWQEQQNDLSASDSGYSMTTTSANDSSKQQLQQPLPTIIKIDFEPIAEPKTKLIPTQTQASTVVDDFANTLNDKDDSEKIDLDKATNEQLDKYELNQDLIQKIKQKDYGKDKTLGQQILDQEVNLDNGDQLKQLDLDNHQANILKQFFFPTTQAKQIPKKRIISYSPEPGRFVELTTLYNQSIESRGEGIADTKLIHIQEKQLSSDLHAMKRNAENEEFYYSPPQVSVPQQWPKPQPTEVASHDENKPPPIDIKQTEPVTSSTVIPKPVETKKRKSSGTGGIFACFSGKKSKSDAIRAASSGQAPITKLETPLATQSSTSPVLVQQTSRTTVSTKPPAIDYGLKDGKRIYIDEYRERPGLDMSYRPPNFETNFIILKPVTKSSEYEEQFHALSNDNHDDGNKLNSYTTPTIEQIQVPPVIDNQQASPSLLPKKSSVESSSSLHLEPRPPTFEIEKPSTITKSIEQQILITTSPSQNTTVSSLRGAAVQLPSVEFEKPGPVEANLSLNKQKTGKVKVSKTKKESSSTGGLCASCFGTKASKKQKQEGIEPKEKVTETKKTSDELVTRKDDNTGNKQQTVSTFNIPKVDLKGPTIDIKQPTLPNIEINQSVTSPPPPIDIETKKRDIPAFESKDSNFDLDLNVKNNITGEPLDKIHDKPTTSVIPEFSFSGSDLNLDLHKTKHSVSSFEVPDLNIHADSTKQMSSPATKFDIPDAPLESEIIHNHDLQVGEIPNIKLHEQNQPTVGLITDDINLNQQIPDYTIPDLKSLPKVDIEDGAYDIPHVEVDKTLISLPVGELPKLHIKDSDLDLHMKQKKIEVDADNMKSEGASGDFVVETPTVELPKVDLKGPSLDLNISGDSQKPIISTINIESQMPKVDVRDSSKGSYTLPKTVVETKSKKKKEKKVKKEKKEGNDNSGGGLFGVFKGKKLSKLTAPHGNLPSVEDSIRVPPQQVILTEPLKAPSTDLPKVSNVDFPTYDRPEVLINSKKNDFQIPAVSLPPLEGVVFPSQNTPDAFHFNRNSDQALRAPFVQLPEVEFTSNIPERQQKEVNFTKPSMPIVEMGLPLATPIIDMTKQQLPEKVLDNEIPTTLGKFSVNSPDFTSDVNKKATLIHPELSLAGTNYDSPSSLPAFGLDHKTEQIEALKSLDTSFEKSTISSITSPAWSADIKHEETSSSFEVPDVNLNLSKTSPPSFETDINLDSTIPKPNLSFNSEIIHDKDLQMGDVPDIKLYEQKQPTISVKQTAAPDLSKVPLPTSGDTTDVQLAISKPVVTKPQLIESTIPTPKKTTGGLCSCFGEKAAHKTITNATETTTALKSPKKKIQAPVANLPPVDLPALESTEVKKANGKPLKAPAVDLPPVDFSLSQSTEAALRTSPTKRPAPKKKLLDVSKPETPKILTDIVVPDIDIAQKPTTPEQIIPKDVNITPIEKPELSLRGPNISLEPLTKPVLLSNNEAKYSLNNSHIVSEVPDIKLKDISSVPVMTNVDHDNSQYINESNIGKKEIYTNLRKTSSSDMKAPVMEIPDLDLKVLSLDESEANISFKKHPHVTEEIVKTSTIIPPLSRQIDQQPQQQAPLTSRSDSGLEQIVSSHIHPSLTFGTDQSSTYDFSNSVSSGLGSEIIDGVAHKGYTLPSIKSTYENPEVRVIDDGKLISLKHEGGVRYDFNKKIMLDDDLRTKLLFRQEELKTLLEAEVSSTMEDFDGKKDQKHLQKIIQHSIDLIKDKKVSSYPELKTQLIMSHKNEAYIVDPVVNGLFIAIEKHNLDNIDRPEVAMAIRDMVKHSSKQSVDTMTYFNTGTTNKPEAIQQSPAKQPDTIPKLIVDSTQDARKIGATISKDNPSTDIVSSQNQTSPTMTKGKQKSPIESGDKHVSSKAANAGSSCLMCGRQPKSTENVDQKSSAAIAASGNTSSHSLLDERRRQQLNSSKNELATTIRDRIQLSSPPIKNMNEQSKDVDKIIRKTLQILLSPKVYSYEQVRNDLKTEHKQTFYLVDPIVDIVRDTLERCDIQNMQDKINIDILDSNIRQAQELYNQASGQQLLSPQELEYLKENQNNFIKSVKDTEKQEKKINKKQENELQKILDRTCEILSTQQAHTWDEIHQQLKREYPKTHDLDGRAIESIKAAHLVGRLKSQIPQDVIVVNVVNGAGDKYQQIRQSNLLTEKARQTLHKNKPSIVNSIVQLLLEHNKNLYKQSQIEKLVNETFDYLQNNKNNEFRTYDDLKNKLKRDHSDNHNVLIEQIVDVIEQAHVTSQFEDMDKNEVQTLMKDRLYGKPLILKEIHINLPPRQGAYMSQQQNSSYLNDVSGDSTHLSLTNGTNSHASRHVARGLSWREANERARILFYRGRHPAIHYDEKTAGFDVRMLLETQTGVQQEIPVTDEDVHRLLNTCGVQWDGANVISLIDRSEAYVKEAERDALKLIKESGTLDQLKIAQQQQKINDEQQQIINSSTNVS